jgi:rubredoxin
MADIIALEDVKSTRVHREVKGGEIWTTTWLSAPKGTRQPQFFMVENTPNRLLRTHYHDVDQFQIIVGGDGKLGKHAVAPFTVHFARAHTPYGPLHAGDSGLTWLTIRARRDAEGAQFIPDTREKLVQVANRNPWQTSEDPVFDLSEEDISLCQLPTIKDDRGLAAYALRMRAGAKTVTPDPSGTGGQYVVVLRGSLINNGKEQHAIAMSFVTAEERPLELTAGPQGLEAVVLNFPRVEPLADKTVSAATGRYKTWRCVLCGFVYDEAAGMPDEGVAPGTLWADVPETWNCPDCLASKQEFDMVEIENA